MGVVGSGGDEGSKGYSGRGPVVVWIVTEMPGRVDRTAIIGEGRGLKVDWWVGGS